MYRKKKEENVASLSSESVSPLFFIILLLNHLQHATNTTIKKLEVMNMVNQSSIGNEKQAAQEVVILSDCLTK